MKASGTVSHVTHSRWHIINKCVCFCEVFFSPQSFFSVNHFTLNYSSRALSSDADAVLLHSWGLSYLCSLKRHLIDLIHRTLQLLRGLNMFACMYNNLSISVFPWNLQKITWYLCKPHLLSLCCRNEMLAWSLADDNELKKTNNLSPVGF